MTEPLLRLERVSCERDGRALFRDLCVVLGPGAALELRGPNGSGKSTLIRAVAGLYPDYSGTIAAADSLYLGHRPAISTLLTAQENLRWYGALGQPSAAAGALRARTLSVDEALARVGMDGYQHVSCGQMSAGQQRRVGLARLLLCEAPLWLLDEPLTALDSDGQNLVRRLVGEHLGAGGAALCATHQALELADAAVLDLAEPARHGVAVARP